jgi:AmmeMemoRadiSam system protein A
MDPTSWDERGLSHDERAALLRVARAAIVHGVHHGCEITIDEGAYSLRLQAECACFVTLELAHELRGCVGTLRARTALVREVAHAAYSAAFRDTRFAPVAPDEAPQLSIHISILSAPTELHFHSERDLLAQLRPGVDGLILSDGTHLGTFLPEVWEKFPAPDQFLHQLRLKAGLAGDYWSATLRVERYTTVSFG